jgi:single-strand DNA-binding protein
MNSCTFTGRIVADAEMRTTASGTTLCKVRIASDTGWGDNVKTHWLDGVIFGNRGVSLQPHLTKGTPITVIGDLEPPRTYETQQGETRVAQSLVVREIALQGGKQGQGSGSGSKTAQRASEGFQAPRADFDDDILF